MSSSQGHENNICSVRMETGKAGTGGPEGNNNYTPLVVLLRQCLNMREGWRSSQDVLFQITQIGLKESWRINYPPFPSRTEGPSILHRDVAFVLEESICEAARGRSGTECPATRGSIGQTVQQNASFRSMSVCGVPDLDSVIGHNQFCPSIPF
jgi:hypothetical protein